MTEERMALLELEEKGADADLVRDVLAFAAGRIMEAEAEIAAGAAKSARSPLREVYRNGYRKRAWIALGIRSVAPAVGETPVMSLRGECRG